MSDVFLGKPSKNIVDFIERQRCFWLEAEEDGLTIEFSDINGGAFPIDVHISISRDEKKTWSAYDGYVIGTGTEGDPVLKAGDRVYFRAGHLEDPADFRNETISTSFRVLSFKLLSAKVKARGNLNCLLKKDGKVDRLADYCYIGMFLGCTSLTAAPQLPATQLADYCYFDMFSGCTSLTQAPTLPATQLAYCCYAKMFSGCTSLTAAPQLPATQLADYCYLNMFDRCTSLSAAPQLSAKQLADGCYYGMFYNCSKLLSINVNFTTWNPSNATEVWVQGVASSGTFTCPASLPQIRGTNNIPTNWTIVTKQEN